MDTSVRRYRRHFSYRQQKGKEVKVHTVQGGTKLSNVDQETFKILKYLFPIIYYVSVLLSCNSQFPKIC